MFDNVYRAYSNQKYEDITVDHSQYSVSQTSLTDIGVFRENKNIEIQLVVAS